MRAAEISHYKVNVLVVKHHIAEELEFGYNYSQKGIIWNGKIN